MGQTAVCVPAKCQYCDNKDRPSNLQEEIQEPCTAGKGSSRSPEELPFHPKATQDITSVAENGEKRTALCDFVGLPLFMQQVALAVAALKVFRSNGKAPTHNARKQWEMASYAERGYWAQSDLGSNDLEMAVVQAEAAFQAVPRLTDAELCTALARAVHRFRGIPGAQERGGLAWIENTVVEAGKLLRMPQDSRGDGGLGNDNKEAKECNDALQQAWSSMKATPQDIEYMCEGTERAVARLKKKLAWARCKIIIISSVTFNHKDTKELVKLLAAQLCERLGNQVAFILGGLGGAQEAFVQGCNPSRVYNLVPVGQSSLLGMGIDLHTGANLEQRVEVTKRLGDLYISCEGGPNCAAEAAAAIERNVPVIPLMRTGGASSGMFNFPAQAMQRPSFASESHWRMLSSEEVSVEKTATVVTNITAHLVASLPDHHQIPRQCDSPDTRTRH